MNWFGNKWKGPWWRKLMIQLFRLSLIYGAYLMLLSACETSMLFPGASRETRLSRERLPTNEVRAMHEVGNGATAESWLIRTKHRNPTPPLLVLSHGNGEIIDDHMPTARTIAARGTDVLLIGLPGYAAGDGKPTAKGMREAGRLAYDWAIEQRAEKPPRVIGFAFSMGTGLVCSVAGDRGLDALILCAPFDSIAAVAKRVGIPSFLIRNKIDNVKALDGYQGDVYILHGGNDTIIPPAHSEALAKSLDRAERVVVDGVGHNDLFNSDLSLQKVDSWLTELLPLPETPAPESR